MAGEDRASPRIQELPEAERPREKLAALGAAALADSELIAILLRVGIKGCSAIDLARDLLKTFGSLSGLARAPVAQIARERGLGLAKATQLAAAFGLAARLAREMLVRTPMDNPEAIYELLGAELRQLGKESLRVILLDTRLCLLRVEEVSLGSLAECIAHPREILRHVILAGAHGFVLAHNHPSGDPTPSDADRRLTLRMAEAAKLMQITFADHVVIGSPSPGRSPFFSFRQSGIL